MSLFEPDSRLADEKNVLIWGSAVLKASLPNSPFPSLVRPTWLRLEPTIKKVSFLDLLFSKVRESKITYSTNHIMAV